jgi:Uma2 family endonuclease
MPYAIKKPTRPKKLDVAASSELVTFQKFYDTVDETTRADLLDGLIIRDSPAVPRHADVVTWTSTLLRTFADARDLGMVLTATAAVRLSLYNAPEPDIFFIRKSRLSIVNDKFVDGPPDLCVEVISKSSRKYDRGRKFVLYAEHGVREYWIIDPLRKTLEFFENRGGEFAPTQPDERGRLCSKVLPGFWLKPEWLAAEPLPNVLEILREILGEPIV